MERRKVQGGENVWRRRRNDNDFRSKNQSEKRKKLNGKRKFKKNSQHIQHNIQHTTKQQDHTRGNNNEKKKIQFSFLSLNPNTS